MAADAIEVHRAATRFRTVTEGTDTRHSFSFGAHYDPGNVGFGPLLVHNDDRVRSGAGYPDHPHVDAEIVTWVLDGSLVHEDSTGHRGLVTPGLAQRLSAGAGVVHAERNDAFRTDPAAAAGAGAVRPDVAAARTRPARPPRTPPVRSTWPTSSRAGARWPRATTRTRRSAWRPGGPPCGSPGWRPGSVRLLPAGAQAHVFVATGAVEAEAAGRLDEGDALRLSGPAQLRLTGVRPAEVLVWTMMDP